MGVITFSYIIERKYMKVILIFILFFFISAEIKAQLGITSLSKTLSNIQCVKIIELPAQ
jgi:hypothetical protein